MQPKDPTKDPAGVPKGLSDAEREAVQLLQQALEKISNATGNRKRVRGHIEEALACLRDPRESIRPSQLNSANDG